MRLIHDVGAGLSDSAKNGWAPLTLAAQDGHLEAVWLLCDAGVDMFNGHDRNWTVLMIAAAHGQLEIVLLLRDAGGDVSDHDDADWTPLMLATQEEHLKVVWLLCNAGLDVSHSNANGVAALQVDAGKGHAEIVGTLVSAGADIVHSSISFTDGMTAMRLAAAHSQVDKTCVLLVEGAQETASDNLGCRPICAVGKVSEERNPVKVRLLLARERAFRAHSCTGILLRILHYPRCGEVSSVYAHF